MATALKNKLQNSYQKKFIFNADSIAQFTAFSLQMTSKKNLHLPMTEKMSKGIFSLPLYPKLKYSEAYKVAEVLKNIVKTI